MLAIVEIPNGSIYKYEVCKNTGALMLDRVLAKPSPANYGYIHNTLAGDGDPLDTFILGNDPIQPLARVNVKLMAIIRCIDNGEQDDKLVGIIDSDNVTCDLSDLEKIEEYLRNYKPGFEVLRTEGPVEAEEAVIECQKACMDKLLADMKASFHGIWSNK